MKNGDHSNGHTTSRKNLSTLKELDNNFLQSNAQNSRQSIYKSPIAIRDADDYQITPQNKHNNNFGNEYLKVPNQVNKKNSNSNNSLNGDGRNHSKNTPDDYDNDNSRRNSRNTDQLLAKNIDLDFPDDPYDNGYDDNDVENLPTSRSYQDITKKQPPPHYNSSNNINHKPATNGIQNKTQNGNGKPPANKEPVDPSKMRDPRMAKNLEQK